LIIFQLDKMNEIKAVVFDLGMVLIPFNYDFALNRLNLIKPGSGEKVMEFVRENYHYFRAFEAGKLTTEEFIPMLMKAGEVEDLLSIDEFCFIYSEIFSINYDVAELLSRLKQNYRLFLLSNTNPVHRKYGYENFKFFRHFEKLFYSDEVGHVKPAPEIYQAVEKYSGLKPEEHLFIDDIFEYAEGARNCDWKAIQFFTYNQLLKELRAMGFLL
jgi:epoxide hydrolase-like predicted phosphatase